MGKQIVFFDIDGTIYDEDKQIPLSTEKAIKTLQGNGIYVVIATGRPTFMFEGLRKRLGIDSYISYTGQQVVFEGETLYEKPLCKHGFEKLYKESVAGNYPMILMSDMEMKATVAEAPLVINTLDRLKYRYPEVDLDFYNRQRIFQALLFSEGGNVERWQENHDAFHFIHWGNGTLDVLPKGGSKAIGMRKILDATGINRQNSIAFGDGMNDLEMIQKAGIGVAMGNSVDQLKQIADHTTSNVELDGISVALKKYGLI
ncbi:Cof-type HAD-IIB family hydrolase [Virgibacillus sp. W0181]|uniref:Cof-type HAD-IIB family hydrolase n=1 Tax=Virgibacillus sp. W0181 TaxID=3391581 RepID=UPI003F45F306